ncbi:MAG: hypothetical protein ACI8RZ_000106 [Myxococcota bacterium]|jgi:hypothetical protein
MALSASSNVHPGMAIRDLKIRRRGEATVVASGLEETRQ